MPLTIKQAADRLGLAPDTLRKQIANGRLKAEKHGRDWSVEAAEVDRYQKENRRPGVA